MTEINVPDMHCEHCVKRITDALNAAGLSFKVSLSEKCVLVDGGESAVATAIDAVYNLGFTPEKA